MARHDALSKPYDVNTPVPDSPETPTKGSATITQVFKPRRAKVPRKKDSTVCNVFLMHFEYITNTVYSQT